jgi:hypothetical protein
MIDSKMICFENKSNDFAQNYFADSLESRFDGLVKSRKAPFFVIPAEAGIQSIQVAIRALDSGFHRSDDFLRVHQSSLS